tara:strand:+ start:1654 stop:1782 length:129 start_codon:yes stop_codon:yes gene_type:complete
MFTAYQYLAFMQVLYTCKQLENAYRIKHGIYATGKYEPKRAI